MSISFLSSVDEVKGIPGKYRVKWIDEEGLQKTTFLQFVRPYYRKVGRGKKLPKELFFQAVKHVKSKNFGKISISYQISSCASANEKYQHMRGGC